MGQVQSQFYAELLRYARKVSRRSDEAEDLLQAVLLAAVEAGRTDMTCAANRRWLIGALRKRALFDARSAVRRRSREATAILRDVPQAECDASTAPFVNTLPPSLRTTALLALTGHTRAEIAWLQRLPDTALRQRFAQIRQRWRSFDGNAVTELPGLRGSLAFGRVRQALLRMVRSTDVMLASHDPDGHLFVVASQSRGSRQHGFVPAPTEE